MKLLYRIPAQLIFTSIVTLIIVTLMEYMFYDGDIESFITYVELGHWNWIVGVSLGVSFGVTLINLIKGK